MDEESSAGKMHHGKFGLMNCQSSEVPEFDITEFENHHEISNNNFLYINKQTEQKVAIRIFLDKDFEERLSIIAPLQHENILQFIGKTRIHHLDGIIMEFFEGKSLEIVIHDKDRSHYTLEDAFTWIIQTALGLEYLRSIELFIDEITSKNILLNTSRDMIKIAIDHPAIRLGSNLHKKFAENRDVYCLSSIISECLLRETSSDSSVHEYLELLRVNRIPNASAKFNKIILRCYHEDPSERPSISSIRSLFQNMLINRKSYTFKVIGFFFENFSKAEDKVCIWSVKDEFLYYYKPINPEFSDDFTNEVISVRPPIELFPEKSFKIIRELGKGYFATVKLAKFKNNQQVALKIMTIDGGCMKRLLVLEYLPLQYLSHPNILKVIGRTRIDHCATIVLEYMEGGSLDKIIPKISKQFTLEHVLSWNLQSASALEYMHNFRYLHRDIKPQNMVLDKNFQVLKLCDFGQAKALIDSDNTGDVGTLRYIAPEVFKGENYDEKSDIYSWTLVFWQCCSRKLPFSSCSNSAALMAAKYKTDYLLGNIDNASPAFNKIIENCSNYNHRKRPPISEIKRMLERMLKNCQTLFSELSDKICIRDKKDGKVYVDELHSENFTSQTLLEIDLEKAKAESKVFPFESLKILKSLRDHGRVKLIKVEKLQKVYKIYSNSSEFDKEFLFLANFKHKNIVSLFGRVFDEELNLNGIITEYIKGENLFEVLHKKPTKFLLEDILSWTSQCADALEYMHSFGIIHCNIIPRNLLLSKNFKTLKVCDFSRSYDLNGNLPFGVDNVGISYYTAPEALKVYPSVKFRQSEVRVFDRDSRQKSPPSSPPDTHKESTSKSSIEATDESPIDSTMLYSLDVYSVAVIFWECCTSLLHQEGQTITPSSTLPLMRIENASEKFNEYFRKCTDRNSSNRPSMASLKELFGNLLKNSDYNPEFENIQNDSFVKDNMCIWNVEEEEFYYYKQ